MRCVALTLLATCLAAPAGASVAADAAIVVAMEREFAAHAAEHGWVEAFRPNSAPDGKMAGPGGIAPIAASLEGAPAGDRSLAAWPVLAGAFGCIWQYRDGRWVIIYDQLVEQPPPAVAASGN